MSPESFIIGSCFTGAGILVVVGIVSYLRARAARWERLNDRVFDAETESRDLRGTLNELRRDAKEIRESIDLVGGAALIQHGDIERLANHFGLEFRDVNASRKLSPVNRA